LPTWRTNCSQPSTDQATTLVGRAMAMR
jgi:hypothetical protein